MSTGINQIHLNLARKWRGQCFDQIIGQELSVKILKNSLYRDHLFPVYLFWGQRGTGKTSMARVFAAAINCELLPRFQKEPKAYQLPCMQCPSCLAMQAGKHPDFIEIDAASHTGVDNVRQIIDSASFLSIMGRKKIYLVDEAHMLSKAAFNALLKVLEEPPASALFILATTDPQKIIETVRSRCLQVCFKPVDSQLVCEHLKTICAQEAIYADRDALLLIANQTEGSVRDAINMLEQVRFAQGRVTSDSVLAMLGHIDDDRLCVLLDILFRRDTAGLLQFLQANSLEQFDAEYIWKRLVELVRMIIWLRYGLTVALAAGPLRILSAFAKKVSAARVADMLQMIYDHERLFAKTTGKHLLLEMLLLKICRHDDTGSEPAMNPISQQPVHTSTSEQELETDDVEQDSPDDNYNDDETACKAVKCGQDAWNVFVREAEALNDPLVLSVFKNGSFRQFDKEHATVEVAFAKQFVFFQDWIVGSTANWKPLLDKIFGCSVVLKPIFTEDIAPVVSGVRVQEVQASPIIKNQEKVSVRPVVSEQQAFRYAKWQQPSGNKAKKPIVNVSDAALWPKATMLLQFFPGVVREG